MLDMLERMEADTRLAYLSELDPVITFKCRNNGACAAAWLEAKQLAPMNSGALCLNVCLLAMGPLQQPGGELMRGSL